MNINIEINLLKDRIAKLEDQKKEMTSIIKDLVDGQGRILEVISAMGKGQTRSPKEKKAAE